MIYCNSRILEHQTTGVQRYLSSILNSDAFSKGVNLLKPSVSFFKSGIGAHLWEQIAIPLSINNESVLWSPSNTGPLVVKSRHVVTIHDFATLDHPEWTSKKFNLFYRFLLPKLSENVDAIIAVSDYTKDRIIFHTGIDESKIHTIRNGVDSGFFVQVDSGRKSNVLGKYKIPSSRFILSVSSIEPRKNLSTLLMAWDKIHATLDDDIWLVLAGRKNTKIFADAGLNHLPPRVHFTGFVDEDDLVVLYQSALFFTYLSLYEGFGLPPLEAMAAGIPVLSSNTTSIPEVVSDKAITVDPLSVLDVADNILMLADSESLRQELSLAGVEHAKQFTWNNAAQKTFDLLKSME
jgi:glycosyltransferase involved in cell wall biosynthesis